MNKALEYLSAHLLPVITTFFALGVCCATACKSTNELIFLLPLLSGGGALLSRLYWRPRTTLVLLLIFVAALGFVHGNLADRKPASPHHILHLIPHEQEVVLICTLDRLPGYNGDKSTLVVDIQSLRLQGAPDFTAAHGLAQLRIKGPWPQELQPGDQLAIRAELTRPQAFHNPGSFDYPAFLAREDIWISGWINSPLHIHKLPAAPSFIHQARYLPERLRAGISAFIQQRIEPEISAVYKALLIGDASGISEKTLEAFKGSGCMHILSISGAHLSILATFLFFSAYWLLRRSEYLILHFPVKKLAAALCLLPLFLYTLLAGANTPVIRSLIMISVFMTALCADKQQSLFNPLALAALLLLLWNPSSLFTASFQLSFMAVASIAAVTPTLARFHHPENDNHTRSQHLTHQLTRATLTALAISLAVTVGTTPLLLMYFNRISIVGPVANLPIEALICFWSLPLGFLACPFIFIAPQVAELLLHFGAYGLKWALLTAEYFNSVSFANLWLPTPHPFLILFYYGTLIAGISGVFPSRQARAACATLWLAVVLLFYFPPGELVRHFARNSKVTFLDIGQGSSTFLQLPSGGRVLIDGGSTSSSPGFNAGEDIIAPFLWKRGVSHLDAIIITHADADHYNGIPFLLRRFNPATLWINERSGHDRAWPQLLTLADSLHIQVRIPDDGETLISRDNASIVNLTPSETVMGTSNDQSLILRFTHDSLTCLFPGDITQTTESRLVANGTPLRSRILLSPHHGSATSSSEAFLKAVAPEIMVVSAGRYRPDTFPAPEVRRRCDTLGIIMLTTAEQGAVTIDEKAVTSWKRPAGIRPNFVTKNNKAEK